MSTRETRNYIPGLTDIHTHILYGVDDGAKSVSDAMGLLEEESRQGVEQILLTPHYGMKFGHPEAELLRERYHKLCMEAEAYYPNLKLYLGSELYYEQETVRRLKEGSALTLNGTSYVLVEFGVSASFSGILRAVQELCYAGFRPVLAHVERYQAVFGHLDRAWELVDSGALLQVNAGSVIGGFLDKKAAFCRKLLKEGLLHLLGSDCHDLARRVPNMERGAEILLKKKAEHILIENPQNLLKGKSISVM